jgi:signal peptidase II
MSAGVSRKYLFLFVVALSVVVLDQWTKYLTVRELTWQFDGRESLGERLQALYGGAPPQGFDGFHFRPKRSVELSESFLRLRYAENPGAAWGMFRSLPSSVRGPLFHVVSLGAVILIFSYFRKLSGKDASERWAQWGLSLVLGGALGNYTDRMARGFVIDFIEAHWYDKATWPNFNVADSAIVVGVGLLLVDAFVRKEQPAPTAPTA